MNMKKNTIAKKERKILEALQHLGFTRVESHTLMYLLTADGVTAKDIEENADLRQPEVSNGINALINRGWIKTSLIPKKGKGRPYYKYYLAKTKKEIINSIQRDAQKKIEAEQQSIDVICGLLET